MQKNFTLSVLNIIQPNKNTNYRYINSISIVSVSN